MNSKYYFKSETDKIATALTTRSHNLIALLITDKSEEVRAALVLNDNLNSHELYIIVLNEKSSRVKLEAAKANIKKFTYPTVKLLCEDESEKVRAAGKEVAQKIIKKLSVL